MFANMQLIVVLLNKVFIANFTPCFKLTQMYFFMNFQVSRALECLSTKPTLVFSILSMNHSTMPFPTLFGFKLQLTEATRKRSVFLVRYHVSFESILGLKGRATY